MPTVDQNTLALLKRMRRLRLKTRGRVAELFGGAYQSCFRGQGMDFDDFRIYEPGDEIRAIDWNVTARLGETHIRQFIEERELAVYLVFDISASGDYGSGEHSKREWMAEIAALVGFSALKNQDKLGVVLFSSKLDLFLPPKKGTRQLVRVIHELLGRKPTPGVTDLDAALRPVIHQVSRRSLVFFISDFIGENLERNLRTASQRHDVIALQIADPAETRFPKGGRVRLRDPETGEERWLNTSRAGFAEEYRQAREVWQKNLDHLFSRLGVDKLHLECGDDYLPTMHAFFKNRSGQR